MSTTVTYKGSTLTTVNNQTRMLTTSGKYLEDDITLVDVTSGGGSVTQDQDGFIVLPPDGGGSPSVGGLVYETGTWTPSEDVADYGIPFANTHTAAPFYYLITDTGADYYTANYTNHNVCVYSPYLYCGASPSSNGTDFFYLFINFRYRGTSATAITAGNTTENSVVGISTWASSTGIRAYTNSTSRYWRAGRTYKWIAVWAPTT